MGENTGKQKAARKEEEEKTSERCELGKIKEKKTLRVVSPGIRLAVG